MTGTCDEEGCDAPVVVPKHGLCRRCYNRAYQAGTLRVDRYAQCSPVPVGVSEPGRLAVTCWCEATIVQVPAARLRAGQTASCGHPACQAPVGS